jgi:phosphotransferase system HPr (HPr) family protein
MPSITAVVGSASGLHARPAALFVEAVARQSAEITIRTKTKPAVPANSILSVLSLGAKCGTEVVLEAKGADAQTALTTLAALLSNDLDAEEESPAAAEKTPVSG